MLIFCLSVQQVKVKVCVLALLHHVLAEVSRGNCAVPLGGGRSFWTFAILLH